MNKIDKIKKEIGELMDDDNRSWVSHCRRSYIDVVKVYEILERHR